MFNVFMSSGATMTPAPQLAVLKYVRPEVVRFAIAMEAILRENDHKSGWIQPRCGTVYLMSCLEKEIVELKKEISINHKIPAMKEACDGGNFEMMLFDTFWYDSHEDKHRQFEKLHSIPFNLDKVDHTSHTPTTSAELVLEELEKRLDAISGNVLYPIRMGELIKIIQELRQQAERERERR